MSRLLTKILNDPPGQKSSPPVNKLKSTVLKPAVESSGFVDVHQLISGRPQTESVDEISLNVGVHKTQETTFVDVNTPTKTKSGRPQNEQKKPASADRHRDQLFRTFRAKHNLEIQEFFTLAALNYLDFCGRPQTENVGVFTSHDDRRLMILYNTRTSIISIYQKYHPQNKWKPTDDREASRFNEVDEKIIELAILQTQGNAGYKKIHSFKYYTTEIEYLLEINLQPETIDAMLERRRQQWYEFKLKK
jgi:hypothetical protein